MKGTILKSACLLIVVLFTTNVVFSQTNEEYKAKIEKMNKEMAKAMLEGKSNLSIYTPDAISMPSYEPMHMGIAEITKAHEAMMKSGWKATACEINTSKVMKNGDQIIEIGTYKITMTMPGMEKPMDDHGKYLTIWEKQKDGSLKTKIETWNTDVNPMSMMSAMEPKEPK
jgi:ketosteroid isomerase-like protein